MKHANRGLTGVMVASFTLIMLALPIHAFISTWGGTAIGPLLVWKAWKEILLTALVPVVVIYCVRRPDVVKKLWSRPVNKLIAGYAVLMMVFATVSQASIEAVMAGLLMNLRFLAMFALAQIVAVHLRPGFVKKVLGHWLVWVAVGISLLAIVQVTLLPKNFFAQFGYDKDTTIAPYILVDQNQDVRRAFATLRGPNELGAFLILPLVAAMAVLAANRRSISAGIAVGLGVVALGLSGSRSAWLGALAGSAALFWWSAGLAAIFRWLKWGWAPAIVCALAVLWLSVSVPAVRLAVLHSSPGDSSLLEGSTGNHWNATWEGIRDVVAHPLGQGVGVAGPASFYNKNAAPKIAENYFVQVAQEAGLLGLGLFVAINALVAYSFWQQRQQFWPRVLLASFVGLSLVNIFLHGWADDPTSMTWWGVAGLILWANQGKKHES